LRTDSRRPAYGCQCIDINPKCPIYEPLIESRALWRTFFDMSDRQVCHMIAMKGRVGNSYISIWYWAHVMRYRCKVIDF
jgi:hypothetical protein